MVRSGLPASLSPMSKGHGQKLRWDERAAEVLAGRAKLDAISLIALVNEVNPTGRGRDKKENAARYALKARLESVLVKNYPEAIEVSPEPEHEGVVSIRHKVRQQFACHAALNALDDDARSWVQRQLDLASGETDRNSAPPPRQSPSSLPAETRTPAIPKTPKRCSRRPSRAEAEYDFERAGRLYPRAFAEFRDTRARRSRSCTFLVDAMAADSTKPSRWTPICRTTYAITPGVRVLLALAAARCSGDEALAVGYLAHVEDPRAAEVFARSSPRVP